MSSRGVREVAAVFLRLGFTAFGGPAAHIAAMEDEVVRRRRWVTRVEFADLLSAANVIPGPNSTELAIHLGYRRAGWLGLVVAGLCFIVPATVMVWIVAWWYVRVGRRPEVAAMFVGTQPVVLAVVVQAVWRLRVTVLRTTRAWVIALVSVGALLLGVNELVVLAGAAACGSVRHRQSAMGKFARAMVDHHCGKHGNCCWSGCGRSRFSCNHVGRVCVVRENW